MAFTADRAVSDIARLRPGMEPVIYSDVAVNDSDKSLSLADFLVDGEALEVVGVRIEYTASATAGTRVIGLQVLNGSSDVVWSYVTTSNANVTATNTVTIEASVDATAGAAVVSIVPERLPRFLMLDSGHSLRVYAVSGDDTGVDDMVVHVRGVIHR